MAALLLLVLGGLLIYGLVQVEDNAEERRIREWLDRNGYL